MISVENYLISFFFWASFCVFAYTFIFFPLLIVIRGLLYYQPVRFHLHTPKVSIIIAVFNEASIINQKLDNTFSINYPPDCLEVILASDGSNDGTEEIVKNYEQGEIKLLSLPRQGKNQAINSGVAVANGDILVFTDSDTMFMPDALSYLVAPFSDPQVGGVAGNYKHMENKGEGANERDFWNFERTLKLMQSRAGSVTSAWGPIYAIRKSFYMTIPGGVTDDYFVSVQPLMNHRRLVFEPRAVAIGPVAPLPKVEFQRKVRIITAGLRGVWQTRKLLNPFKYKFLAIQIFSHKVLRRLLGIPLLLLLVTALLSWHEGFFFKLMTVFQLMFHSFALFGFLLHNSDLGKLRLLRWPFFMDMIYIASVVAMFNLLRGKRFDIWTPQKLHKSHERE